MGGKTSNKPISGFTADDKQLLVRIVKTAQGRRIRGQKGDWKEFLATIDKKAGATISDPAKRPWETLATFVQTFTSEEDIQMVKRFRHWDKRCKRIEHLESQGILGESPEQDLVRLTRQHSRFKGLYSFPSYNEGWVMAKLGKANDSMSSERMISLDCEMVMCEQEEHEVVRVCAVDRDCKTLLDMLVKPTKPVVDYLTSITGVSEADLEGVILSPADAQREVTKLLTPGTILVGHSLHNDLRALKIDHARVIDTAFIFQYHNKVEGYNAGLNDLCKAVLGHGFREEGGPHNCLDDAIIPMQIVLHKIKHSLNDPLNISTPALDEGQLSRLYLHSIPTSVSTDDLQDIFPKQCSCEFQDISRNKHKTGTTYAVFKSSFDADKAFKELVGQLGKDSYGRPQKRVAISVFPAVGKTEELFIKVRKMASIDDSRNELLDSDAVAEMPRKRSRQSGTEDVSGSIKNKVEIADGGGQEDLKKSWREKSCGILIKANSSHEKEDVCKQHLKDIDNLRKQLKDRDLEILSLQKIIVALTRRQGL